MAESESGHSSGWVNERISQGWRRVEKGGFKGDREEESEVDLRG